MTDARFQTDDSLNWQNRVWSFVKRLTPFVHLPTLGRGGEAGKPIPVEDTNANRPERPEKASGRDRRGCHDRQDRDRRNSGYQQGQDRQDPQWGCWSGCSCQSLVTRGADGDRQEGSRREVGLMAARLDSAARYICAKGDWSVSNLQLQKLLYLAQMIHMGRHDGARLFDGAFQAWDYGPVEPSLYHRVKSYGSNALPDVFADARSFSDADPRKKTLDDVCARFLSFTPGELVDITHWDGGAWAKYYVPNAKSVVIPNAAILEEYRARNGSR